MRFSGLSLCALLIVATAAAPAKTGGHDGSKKGGTQIDTLVDLGYTRYQGVQLAAGVNQYLGLRYAAPPLGNLRFRAPANPPRNATVQPALQVRNDSSAQQWSAY